MYFIDDLFNRRFFFTRSEQPREIVILINDILIPTCFFPPLKRSLLAHAIFGFDKENFFSVIKKKKKKKTLAVFDRKVSEPKGYCPRRDLTR